MATRILGWAVVMVVIAYHGLRLILTACSGPSCDAYSPLTLLLPVAALVLAGVTGAIAAYEARARRNWSILLAACAMLAFAGPIVVALALSDNDTKVWVSTLFVLTVPVAVGLSVFWKPTTIKP